MKRYPSNVLFGNSSLLILLICIVTSCSKGGGSGNSSASGNGTGVDVATGPSNTWLSGYSSKSSSDSTYTEIQLNSSHTVEKVVFSTFIPSDTSYFSAIIPVYTNGKITALQQSTDTTAASGTPYAQFTYGKSWIKVQYVTGATYDSVVGAGNQIAAIYRFEPVGLSGQPTLFQEEAFTWNSQGDISQVIVNTTDTTSGSVSAQTLTYTYDGSFNPYRTLTDAAFILGSAVDANIQMLTTNNVASVQITGYNSSNSYLYQYNAQSLPTSLNFEYLQQGAIKSSSLTYFQYIAQN
jgi:hypothetical protein